jgi:hypothetical protein
VGLRLSSPRSGRGRVSGSHYHLPATACSILLSTDDTPRGSLRILQPKEPGSFSRKALPQRQERLIQPHEGCPACTAAALRCSVRPIRNPHCSHPETAGLGQGPDLCVASEIKHLAPPCGGHTLSLVHNAVLDGSLTSLPRQAARAGKVLHVLVQRATDTEQSWRHRSCSVAEMR